VCARRHRAVAGHMCVVSACISIKQQGKRCRGVSSAAAITGKRHVGVEQWQAVRVRCLRAFPSSNKASAAEESHQLLPSQVRGK